MYTNNCSSCLQIIIQMHVHVYMTTTCHTAFFLCTGRVPGIICPEMDASD